MVTQRTNSVQVFNSVVDTEKTYTVYRSGTEFRFDSTTADPNRTIILARGGTYNFTLNALGNLFDPKLKLVQVVLVLIVHP